MSELSNNLADLAERIREAQADIRNAEEAAASRALEAGRLLCQAKAECRHGDWLPFLGRAGMAERQAQRFMQLARSGLKSDTVSDLGGIKAALSYLAQAELPTAGEVLLVGQRGWTALPEGNRPPLALIWPSSKSVGFYEVAVIDLGSPDSVDAKSRQAFLHKTNKPVRGESIRLDDGTFVSGVWETVDKTLAIAHGDREFTTVPAEADEDALRALIAELSEAIVSLPT